jgi:hypothetical protein
MRGALAGIALVAWIAVPASAAAQTAAPSVRFHVGAVELASSAGPVSAEDVRWVESHSGDLVEWWEERGASYLSRASQLAGLAWPYADVEVYLVRTWPVLSIEYPLVLALGTMGDRTGEEVPDDDDLHVLLLAHQLTHYLLDDPTFLPRERRPAAYEHPFMAPGNLEAEAMVNWVTYTALEEMWGRERLQRATALDLWRRLNPGHAYVVDELMPRWRLSPQSSLARWLAANPRGSEIFRVHDVYAREIDQPETPEIGGNLTGTDYGLDLGAAFDGAIFVAFVDAASPADRAGARQGDVLATIDGRPVGTDVVDARRRLDAAWQDRGEIHVSVLRDGREVFLTVERR